MSFFLPERVFCFVLTMAAPHSNPYSALDQVDLYPHMYKHWSDNQAVAELHLPTMHCASCVRTLENWPKWREGLEFVGVDFSQQTAVFRFQPGVVRLSELALELQAMGFPPDVSLAQSQSSAEKPQKSKGARRQFKQMAIAGFVFGNTMLFALPEYFGMEAGSDLSVFIRWITAFLSVPLVWFSGAPFLRSAWGALKQRTTNMDVPISLGIAALFVQSQYDVWTGHGPGYFDSLAGLLFFLLIGRWFQSQTFSSLHFERDYRSFFPFSVWVLEEGKEVAKPLESLKSGDLVRVRHGEMVPVDSTVLEGESAVDVSFLTGEAQPQDVQPGTEIPAGAQVVGGALLVRANKALDQKYLTSLWSEDTGGRRPQWIALTDRLGRAFTGVVLGISAAAALAWAFIDPSRIAVVVTSVLIVACPCALALAVPFALGNTVRWLGRHGAFVKSTATVERLAAVGAWVFDKTGTLTVAGAMTWDEPADLQPLQRIALRSLANQSAHPLSRSLVQHFTQKQGVDEQPVSDFEEALGRGISATVNGKPYKLGSPAFCNQPAQSAPDHALGALEDGVFLGWFLPRSTYRAGLGAALDGLGGVPVAVLTGDSDGERAALLQVVPPGTELRFRQKPEEKKAYVQALKSSGLAVAMVGDGLNDAGALAQSDVGITVAEDALHFAPACDVLLRGDALPQLDRMQKFAQAGVRAVRLSIFMSLAYNLVGLSWAVRGALTPEVSALLMPISSLSVVAFTTWYTRRQAKKIVAS
jgi:Cu+-exporting ATPase